MKYLSLCSGIEAASVAWVDALGWRPVAFSEIAPFPCAVLQHRFPNVPNIGDMTSINGEVYRGHVDLIVGGTPCQGFSALGPRGGLSDSRSGLALHFTRLVAEIRPKWLLWENVVGALSTNGGRDFGTFIGALDNIGYSLAWRVLDAQYFGTPQRRRRVFLVGHLGDWRRAAAVLFEREGLRRASPPLEKHEGHVFAAHGLSPQDRDIARCLTTKLRYDCKVDTFIIERDSRIRHLTVLEYERLQGFPDGWTAVPFKGKPATDTPRIRALGNSISVPVMRWIGKRMASII